MAPEYAMQGTISVKSDVFSFGVLLLEIISGKKTSRFHLSEHGQSLLTFVCSIFLNYTNHVMPCTSMLANFHILTFRLLSQVESSF